MTDYATRHLNEVDTAQRVRLTDGHRAIGNTPLSVRGGVRPDGGGVLSLVPGSMKVKLTIFSADVPGAAAGQGGYTFIHDDPSTEYTLLDGDPLGNRKDLVVARVRDNPFDGSGSVDSDIFSIKGSPTTGLPPNVPAGCIPLWEVDVTASASAGSGGVTVGLDRRRWSVAAGGVLPVASTAERDAAALQVGQMVYNAQTDQFEGLTANGWDDSGWINLTFSSGYQAENAALYGTPAVRSKNGVIHFRGAIAKALGSFPANVATTIAAIPSGPLRPPYALDFQCSGHTAPTDSKIRVEANGDVRIITGPTVPGYIALPPINYLND